MWKNTEPKGSSLVLSPEATRYFMSWGKRCPLCGGKMKRDKKFVGFLSELNEHDKDKHGNITTHASGLDYNTGGLVRTQFHVPDENMRIYTYVYNCKRCHSRFPIEELARR